MGMSAPFLNRSKPRHWRENLLCTRTTAKQSPFWEGKLSHIRIISFMFGLWWQQNTWTPQSKNAHGAASQHLLSAWPFARHCSLRIGPQREELDPFPAGEQNICGWIPQIKSGVVAVLVFVVLVGADSGGFQFWLVASFCFGLWSYRICTDVFVYVELISSIKWESKLPKLTIAV